MTLHSEVRRCERASRATGQSQQDKKPAFLEKRPINVAIIAIGFIAAAPIAMPTSAEVATAADPFGDVGQTLTQVRSFAREDGDALWPGYGEAPFGILLLMPSKEVLLCQSGDLWKSAAPFLDAGVDAGTGCSVKERPRLHARTTPRFIEAVKLYAEARTAFAASVDAQDWKYFDFQLWQEGVARWTEIELG